MALEAGVNGAPRRSAVWLPPLLLAALVVAVNQRAREELSVAGASVIALLFAFATPAWSTATRALWHHAPSMLMLTIALALQRRARHFWLLGAVLAFAYVVRPTNAIPLHTPRLWNWRYPPFLTGLVKTPLRADRHDGHQV